MQEDDSVKMQELDDFNQAVEEKSNEIYKIISNQGVFGTKGSKSNYNEQYHFNDFVQDCIDDFDNFVFDVFSGNAHGAQIQVENRLQKWCDDLATKVIKGEV